MTADVIGRKVVAGPIEATAIGNILVQAIGKGHVSSLDEAREIVRSSFEVITYTPKPCPAAEKAYGLFKQIAK